MKKVWIDKRGNEVHPDMVRADEKLKSEMLEKIIIKVIDAQDEKTKLLVEIDEEIEGYMNLLRDVYKIPVKETKGNVTLIDFSGKIKIQKAVSEVIELNEKLLLAKEKIDQVIKKETTEATTLIKTLVSQIFEVDKKGTVNTRQILALRSYAIDDPLWVEAMALIDEAITVTGTKTYTRFYLRESVEDAWTNLVL